ncbi:MAG: polysaccharide lyase family 8 super-sandwich domain-containing protein [Verrucomicrobiota bacterium]
MKIRLTTALHAPLAAMTAFAQTTSSTRLISSTALAVIFAFVGSLISQGGDATSPSRSDYDPQPYTPVENTPAQLADKRAALDNFRDQVANNHWEWDQLGHTESSVWGVLKAANISDPAALAEHFDPADGSWHQPLPTPEGGELTKEDYDIHERYLKEVLALAFASQYREANSWGLAFKTLRWYFDNGLAAPHKYNETFTYGTGTTRTNFSKLLLMFGHLFYEEIHDERAADPEVENLFQQLRSYCRAIINAGPQIRGANWCLRMDHCLNYVLFTNEIADMDEYDYHWKKSVGVNRWEKGGVFPDGSMTHHGDIPYWGKYGDALVSRQILYGEIFKDTPWSYEQERLDFITYYMLEGRRWSYYRGVEDFAVSGDQSLIKTGGLDTSEWQKELLKRLLALGEGRLTREADLREAYHNYDAPFWNVSAETGTATTGRASNLSGQRYLWETDYQIHRRPNYSIFVKRNSQRSRAPETRKGGSGTLHLASGFTPILRQGDELFLSRLSWDYQHIPGTTVEQGLSLSGGGSASTIRGLNLFSGGVTDGQYGFGAFEMNLVLFAKDGSGSYSHLNGAGGLKGTFFFDEGMIALGQGIKRIATIESKSGSLENEILTTINNVKRVSEVVYSINGEAEATVPLSESISEENHFLTDLSWLHHDGIGYVIWPFDSSSTKLVLSFEDVRFNEELKESYKSHLNDLLGKTVGRQTWNHGALNMFRLWIDHGANPANDTYAYAVFPDCTVEQLKDYVADLPFEIATNASGMQAVVHPGEGLYYASFSRAGTADFGSGKSLTVDRPLMVMVRQQGASFSFTAANPQHVGRNPGFIAGEGPAIGVLYDKPVPLQQTGFGGRSDLTFNFSNIRGEEGASVPADQ